MKTGIATSYGDAADMAAYQAEYKRQRANGVPVPKAEALARAKGDPGIGWMDNVVSDPDSQIYWVALPPEDWQPKYGTKKKAHKAQLWVEINGDKLLCILGDTMPSLEDGRKPDVVIDLPPAAQRFFKLKPPFRQKCRWWWVDEKQP